MEDFKLSETQFREYFEELLKLSEECGDLNSGKDDEESRIFQMYALQTPKGKQFYRQIEDEQLLDFLRDTAARLNHSPAQREIFWVWREYIKLRFRKWPYALKAAGLSRAAGAGGKTLKQAEADAKEYQMLLRELREKAEDLCRIPHPQEVPELCERLQGYTDNWNDVIRDANLDTQFFRRKSVYKIENPEQEVKELLRKLEALAETLGRAPLKGEVDAAEKGRLVESCGSWRNALYQIGLEPVIRINPFSSTHLSGEDTEKGRNHKASLYDCYYRVLNPDEQTIQDLDTLYQLKETLKHTPDKKEVPKELRKRLQTACGSWANALFQLEYMNKGN